MITFRTAPAAETLAEGAQRYELLFDGFARDFRVRLSSDDIELGRWVGTRLVALANAHVLPPPVRVHNDFRLDNVLIDAAGSAGTLTVVNWQTMSLGYGPVDVAYFVGTGLVDDPDLSSERTIVERYHRALVDAGVMPSLMTCGAVTGLVRSPAT